MACVEKKIAGGLRIVGPDCLGIIHPNATLLYIERLTNFRKFMSATRGVSRVKSIIVLKADRSEAGAKARSLLQMRLTWSPRKTSDFLSVLLCPKNTPLFQYFFKTLPPVTIYNRVLSHVKKVSPTMLARFSQVDYDREIALVAFDDDPGAERMLGVARITGDPDGKNGEFAVVMGDP